MGIPPKNACWNLWNLWICVNIISDPSVVRLALNTQIQTLFLPASPVVRRSSTRWCPSACEVMKITCFEMWLRNGVLWLWLDQIQCCDAAIHQFTLHSWLFLVKVTRVPIVDLVRGKPAGAKQPQVTRVPISQRFPTYVGKITLVFPLKRPRQWPGAPGKAGVPDGAPGRQSMASRGGGTPHGP